MKQLDLHEYMSEIKQIKFFMGKIKTKKEEIKKTSKEIEQRSKILRELRLKNSKTDFQKKTHLEKINEIRQLEKLIENKKVVTSRLEKIIQSKENIHTNAKKVSESFEKELEKIISAKNKQKQDYCNLLLKIEGRKKKILFDLSQIYSISSIQNILTLGNNYEDFGIKKELDYNRVCAAIGIIAHFTNLLAKFTDKTLLYHIHYLSSKSFIYESKGMYCSK